MKNLTCTCCGGRINRATRKCEYCGTEYIIDDDVQTIRFETFTNPVKEFSACAILDKEAVLLAGNDYMEFAVHKLAEQMLPAVVEGMRITVEDNHFLDQSKITGRLKIVVPQR